VQIALVHQVGSNATSYPFLKQHVVRQNHGRSPARLEGSINVLQKIELRVAGFEGKIMSRRSAAAASLGAEWRIGHDDIGFRQLLSDAAQRVATDQISMHAVQHAVHQ